MWIIEKVKQNNVLNIDNTNADWKSYEIDNTNVDFFFFFFRGIDFFFSNAIVDSLNKIGIGQHCYLFSYILLHLG